MAYRRLEILEAIVTRLSAITTAGGFATNAGQLVFLGETQMLGEDDPDTGIAVVIEPDRVTGSRANVAIELPFEIQALVKVDIDEPHLMVEQVLGDIKKAIELEDRKFGRLFAQDLERGSTRTLPREPGSTTAGAGIQYRGLYQEAWGNP
jgi:hypothetical protein